MVRKGNRTNISPNLLSFLYKIWYVFQWLYTRIKTWVKFDVFAKDCLDDVWRNHFSFKEIFIIWSFCAGTLQANIFCKYVNVFQTTDLISVWKCWLMFYFWIFSVPNKVFFISLSWLIIVCGTAVISDRWTILKIAKDLKTKTFPSVVKFLIRHSLRALSIFTIYMALKIHFMF